MEEDIRADPGPREETENNEEVEESIENIPEPSHATIIKGSVSLNEGKFSQFQQLSLSVRSDKEEIIEVPKKAPSIQAPSPFICKTPFILEKDVIKANRKTLPCVEEEIIKAKQFLKKQGTSGDTLYDHLSDVIQKVLLYQPDDIVDYIEIFSSDLKEERFESNFDRLRNEYILTKNMDDTIQLQKLYKDMKNTRENEINDKNFEVEINAVEEIDLDNQLKIPNIIESNFYFRQAGFGLPDWETYDLAISINRFVSTKPVILTKVRFFGKIFGTCKNYYILETELTLDEIDRRLNPKLLSEEKLQEGSEFSKSVAEMNVENAQTSEKDISIASEMDQSEEEMDEPTGPVEEPLPDLPPLPELKWEPPKDIQREKLGEGLNAKVYWVCNTLGEDWVSLPEVQPKHIIVARKICICMTGNLEKEIHTYPPFDGTEANYIRAQIARIAASTTVSPAEYYIRGIEGEDEEEEVDGEDENFSQVKKNKYYDGHQMSDLVNESLSFWVHHSKFLLKQGRLTWWNPNAKEMAGEGEDEEEEGEGEDGKEGEEREISLPLLIPLTEDEEASDWWSVYPASELQPPLGPNIACLRSLRWPGAVAYATVDGKFDHVYMGWGVKYLPEGYSPPLLPPVSSEYPLGPEIMEILDPTIEEEEEFRIAHLPPLPPLEIPGEEEEMEGEEGVE